MALSHGVVILLLASSSLVAGTYLRKAKEHDLALFGLTRGESVDKEWTDSEPTWQGAGEEVGLKMWKIVKFKVELLPKEDYGNFDSGGSYIVLNTYKENDSDDLLHDVHFWVGRESTKDEYRAAAYKAAELVALLNDAPVQHREVERHESSLFKSYFVNGITYFNGGIDVEPEESKTRLFQIKRTNGQFEDIELPVCASNLQSGKVFILQTSNKLYQWNGRGSNKDAILWTTNYIQTLTSRQGKVSAAIINEGSEDEDFWQFFPDGGDADDEECAA